MKSEIVRKDSVSKKPPYLVETSLGNVFLVNEHSRAILVYSRVIKQIGQIYDVSDLTDWSFYEGSVILAED